MSGTIDLATVDDEVEIGRRLSLWFGEFLLVAIVIVGFVDRDIGDLLRAESGAGASRAQRAYASRRGVGFLA